MPITASHVQARAAIRYTTVVPLSASARVASVEEGEGTVDIPRLGWILLPWSQNRIAQ